MKPRLENKKDGSRILYVFYNNRLADFDKQINAAERRLGVVDDASVTIIALPANGLMKRRMKYKRKVQ